MDSAPAKKYKKRFQRHWYDLDESLKVWLEEVSSDESKCFCKVCNKVFDCGLSEIRKHSARRIHLKNMEQTLRTSSLEVELSNSVSGEFKTVKFVEEPASSLSLKEKIQIAEIKYAAFFAEHNVPLSISSHFLALMQDIGQEPRVLQGMKVGRTKCREIINNVLCVRETKRISDNVRNEVTHS